MPKQKQIELYRIIGIISKNNGYVNQILDNNTGKITGYKVYDTVTKQYVYLKSQKHVKQMFGNFRKLNIISMDIKNRVLL